MDRRSCARAALTAALCAAFALPLAAEAQAWTDLNDWNLTESVNTWGGGTQFHIGTGNGGVAQFRWLDSPNKTTVISANYCTDLSLLGSSSYGVGDTNYHNLFTGGVGTCFVLRGRTGSGQGSMVDHDGRVER